VAYAADLGQNEDLDAVRQKALAIGAKKVYIEDLKDEFVVDFVFKALKSNAIYESKYLLGTSIARPLIAKRQVEVAKKEGAKVLAHGATGKGNDQVRFELTYLTLMPEAEIIAPWKDDEFLKQFQGRADMIEYASKNKIPIKATVKKPYSSDPNVMHISYEAGILEDPKFRPSEDMFELTKSPKEAPDKETRLCITFENGVPVKVENLEDNTVKTKPLDMLLYLNKVAGDNAVGRIDLVENRFVGMKSRGVYETPGYTVLRVAHLDIEGLTMDREVMHIRDTLVPKISELMYYGFWFAPEMEFLMAAVEKSQEYVSGKVYVSLYKGNCMVIGRESQDSLYDKDIASMDVHGGYDQRDSIGFIKLNALRLRMWARKHGFKGVK
ncbi:MAG: argininosuccinate synthase, partial [Candidatus Altiarchaeota archaeon]|nr:argininosuccinate synthase [Candidatus Altiarchaeota archaeon]